MGTAKKKSMAAKSPRRPQAARSPQKPRARTSSGKPKAAKPPGKPKTATSSGKPKAAKSAGKPKAATSPGKQKAAKPKGKPGATQVGDRPSHRATTLLIVESPAKAKTLQKYLDRSYTVMASKGHIKDLPKRGGVDEARGFEETYEIIQEKGKLEALQAIARKALEVQRVLLATDPDREGEAIAWHLKEEIEKAGSRAEIRRVLFNEITRKGVLEGIANLRDLDVYLYEAQRTRRVLDRLGGYQLSNLLWRKLAFGLSAGRVQTPALRILVDQQAAIDSFVPRPYWLIEADLMGASPPAFSSFLESVQGEKLEKVGSRPAATSETDAKRFAEDLKKATYRVARILRRERSSRAPAPYITSKLQQDAANRLGMQPRRTMRVAQALYEGVSIGKGKNAETVGLITYMRTDSTRLSSEAIEACRQHIAQTYGEAVLPKDPNVFKSKGKGVQDAHEAIRPTRMDLPPQAVEQYLGEERIKVYKLIWDRFVACQMTPAVYDQTSAEIEAWAGERRYGLRATGSVLRAPGWKLVYGAADTMPLAGAEGEAPEEGQKALPELFEDQELKLAEVGVRVHAKQTEPPPHYTEASLVKKLEEESIGRPSTYAEILSKVQARDYVHKVKNKLIPSELGRLVIQRLVERRFDLADIDFTRKLEEDLDAVSEARGKRIDILAPFHKRLQGKIGESLAEKGKWWPEPEPVGESCPECGKNLVRRWGRNGLFIGCEGYPDCKVTRSVTTDPVDQDPSKQAQPTEYKCEDCGAPMMKRWGRNGWFLGCSSFPRCKHTRSLPLGVKCPKCRGEIVEIRARGRSRPFYGCRNYNSDVKCDYRIWQRPVPEPCGKCGAEFLVRGGTANAPVLRCLTEGCDYQRPLASEEILRSREDGEGALSATGTEGRGSS